MIPKDCKRLAEVDFPIAEVSRHAAREKSIRHGHPSTLHLWWARRHAVPARPAQPAVPPGTAGLGDRAWRMERDGRGWIMNLKGLSWEEPQGLCLKDSEDAYLQAERRRLIYVAATHWAAVTGAPVTYAGLYSVRYDTLTSNLMAEEV